MSPAGGKPGQNPDSSDPGDQSHHCGAETDFWPGGRGGQDDYISYYNALKWLNNK